MLNFVGSRPFLTSLQFKGVETGAPGRGNLPWTKRVIISVNCPCDAPPQKKLELPDGITKINGGTIFRAAVSCLEPLIQGLSFHPAPTGLIAEEEHAVAVGAQAHIPAGERHHRLADAVTDIAQGVKRQFIPPWAPLDPVGRFSSRPRAGPGRARTPGTRSRRKVRHYTNHPNRPGL